MKRCRLFISGRVQGVWFRQSAIQRANAIGGLTGWVRNLPDSRVEALVEGEDSSVDQLIEWCRQGPPGALVSGVEVIKEPASGDLARFTIAY